MLLDPKPRKSIDNSSELTSSEDYKTNEDFELYQLSFINWKLGDNYIEHLDNVYVYFDCPAFFKLTKNEFSQKETRALKNSYRDIVFEI